jgi:hypothetical protein
VIDSGGIDTDGSAEGRNVHVQQQQQEEEGEEGHSQSQSQQQQRDDVQPPPPRAQPPRRSISHFANVLETTHYQVELNMEIVQLGRSENWEALIDMFVTESPMAGAYTYEPLYRKIIDEDDDDDEDDGGDDDKNDEENKNDGDNENEGNSDAVGAKEDGDNKNDEGKIAAGDDPNPTSITTTATRVVWRNTDRYGLVNLTTALSLLAEAIVPSSLHQRHRQTLEGIIDRICEHMERVNQDNNNNEQEQHQLSNNTTTTLGPLPPLPPRARIYSCSSGQIDARHYATILHSIARMHGRISRTSRPSPGRIIHYLNDPIFCQDFLDQAAPQHVAQVMWSLAKLGRKKLCHNLVAILERDEQLVTRLAFHDPTPQPLANTAWACAKLGIDAPRLLAAIDKRGDWIVGNGETQHISNIAWACGMLQYRAPTFFAAINKRAEWFVRNARPHELTNVKSAVTKLRHVMPALRSASPPMRTGRGGNHNGRGERNWQHQNRNVSAQLVPPNMVQPPQGQLGGGDGRGSNVLVPSNWNVEDDK